MVVMWGIRGSTFGMLLLREALGRLKTSVLVEPKAMESWICYNDLIATCLRHLPRTQAARDRAPTQIAETHLFMEWIKYFNSLAVKVAGSDNNERSASGKVNVWDVSFWVLMAALVCYMAKRVVTIYDFCHPNTSYRHDDFKYVNFHATSKVQKPNGVGARSSR
ncbi:hypothetical protein H310_12612 [Aphanomyces invadans]|uniref:Uncharacterized protein n=1 Tax=Aphanomyces invadans TaxID=157072 RepID=A0A024TJ41_9STRA|nr:hypothetical protein H310_12612 [Aphanomyces invadans]ETV93347.1 hypothetical protein H310_12612 [Aphanomyces invadans]|eukprot:XP_008877983.1 hypothetical protein H310_12612 [Aphanomyces invadans]